MLRARHARRQAHELDPIAAEVLVAPSPFAAPVVVLDLSRINRRFGRESPAAGSRTALWQTFAAERGLRTLATDMSIPENVDRICTLLSGQVR